MEDDSWRVRGVSSGPKRVPLNIRTCKNNVCHHPRSSEEKSEISHLHSPSNYQTAVSKETVEPKISRGVGERGDIEKEQPGANDWQSFRSTL